MLRRMCVGLIASLMLLGLPLAGASGATTTQRASATLAKAAPPASDSQGNIPAALDALGARYYPATYGGLVEVSNGTHIDVYLTQLSRATEAAFAGHARPGDVSFLKTLHSLSYLDAIHQRVINASLGLRAHGIELTEWWPQIQSGKEMIGVENVTAADTTALVRAFGAANVQVFNVPPSQVPVLTSRQNDSSPWKGGDFISDFSFGCTSAFGVTIKGAKKLLTAAHCFPGGDSIYNYNVTGSGSGSGTFMGTIGTRETAKGSVDAEVINANSNGQFWTGTTTQHLNTITNWTTNPVGATDDCNDGAYSGQVCGMRIDNNNECIVPTGFREICHIVHAYSVLHNIANQDGDSGGPVIRIINGKFYAAGIVSAATTARTVACLYNKPDTCYWDIFYSAMDSTLSELGASINT